MSPSEPDTIPEGGRPRGGRRRADARRIRGPTRWVLVGVAIALVIGFASVLLLTQTAWGRGQVLDITLRNIGGRLNGPLDVERLEGNLITGARLYNISLSDTTGAPLALIDSAYVRYRVASFLGGDMVINDLVVYSGRIDLFKLPGDTLWNYEGILLDPTPDPTSPAGASATLIEQMRIYDTRITIRTPVEPDEDLPPALRERRFREMLADTARYVIDEVPGGYLQTALVDVTEAGITELFIGPEERGGTYLEVTDGIADVRLWRDPPLQVRDVQAALHLQDGVLDYQAPRVVLTNSEGASVGQVDMRGGRPLYDVYIASPDFVIADLRWLYPWLPEDPEEGGGSVRLWVDDRENGLLLVARDLELEMPGTYVSGTFGVLVAPEVLRFFEVDLEAEPLRVESVERLLPEDLPVEGLVIGGAGIRGES